MSSKIVTRFAPSPTGYLHVGGARTALFNWLLARHHGGSFLLRIEDTDLARSTQQACDQLLEDLKWLGLHWDNAQLVHQSKRLDVYNAVIADLVKRDLAYEAWETSQELDQRRKVAEKAKKDFIYRRPAYTNDQIQQFKAENRTPVIRFAMPVREFGFNDVILGKDVVVGAEQIQDFVIRKTDGMPTYHFAVVVDDAEMGVTHILRGQEHLLNTINHIGLQEALGYARPTYGHLPIIMNTDGSKMGKRDRDKKVRHACLMYIRNQKKTAADLSALCSIPVERLEEWLKKDTMQLDPSEHSLIMPHVNLREADLPEVLIHDFKHNGYLPEILLNFLALLGWNPGGDREHMSIAQLVELFTIEGIGKSNAKFDRAKLLSFNTEMGNQIEPANLVKPMRDYLSVNPESLVNQATDEQLVEMIKMKKGFRTLREIDEPCRCFFLADDQIALDPAAVEKVLKKNDCAGLKALKEARRILGETTNWTHDAMEAAIKAYCEQSGLGLGAVAQPIRVAVSGTTISPPIFHSLQFLGKERSLKRIDRCLEKVGN